MPRIVKRTEHTYYWNAAPITNLYEALEVLTFDNSSRTPVHLAHENSPDGKTWEILSPWYREGSSGGDSSGIEYFQIDQELAEKLKAGGYLQPRKEVGWGYTRYNEKELVASQKAHDEDRSHSREMEKVAESMLTAGVHTDLAGSPTRLRFGREDWRTGRLHFDYKMSNGDTCRVYPEEKELVAPYPPQEEKKTA
ncbi:MAG: hypothetical protein ABA06_04555 [Parcubacteria bacterium C7867-001]|nr:MAG: hypothetical protein ABA06_04555 [Parcubacteria bacterium C7867-001]